MSTPIYRSGRSLFWPLILIGIGVIWLLTNLGVLSAANIGVLFRLWPLILIIIGVDLLVGRNSPVLRQWIGLGGVALILILMLIGPSLGLVTKLDVKTETYSAALADATSAAVSVSANAAQLTIKPLTDSNNLLNASVKYTGEIEFKNEGETERTISLKEKANNNFGLNGFDWLFAPADQQLRWDIGLNPKVPLTLNISTGVGGATLDLTPFKLTGLNLATGTGGFNVTLPNVEKTYNAQIASGTGGGKIVIQDGAAVTLNLSGGTGGFSIDVPDNAPVRIDGSTGVGGINVPSSFTRISGDDKNFMGADGVWESPTFKNAERQIIIQYKGGTGGLTIE
jgi:hypothetical protein